MRFRPKEKEITEMNGVKRNMADHLIDHLPVELQQRILAAMAKLYPQSANQIHLTPDGKVFIPHGAHAAEPTYYNGSTSPIALATKITHAVFYLLDNEETFRIALSQAFQPGLDPDDVNDEPIVIGKTVRDKQLVDVFYTPPVRNPDGSRPATAADWADPKTLTSLRTYAPSDTSDALVIFESA